MTLSKLKERLAIAIVKRFQAQQRHDNDAYLKAAAKCAAITRQVKLAEEKQTRRENRRLLRNLISKRPKLAGTFGSKSKAPGR